MAGQPQVVTNSTDSVFQPMKKLICVPEWGRENWPGWEWVYRMVAAARGVSVAPEAAGPGAAEEPGAAEQPAAAAEEGYASRQYCHQIPPPRGMVCTE